jgi:hypothetical protein
MRWVGIAKGLCIHLAVATRTQNETIMLILFTTSSDRGIPNSEMNSRCFCCKLLNSCYCLSCAYKREIDRSLARHPLRSCHPTIRASEFSGTSHDQQHVVSSLQRRNTHRRNWRKGKQDPVTNKLKTRPGAKALRVGLFFGLDYFVKSCFVTLRKLLLNQWRWQVFCLV